MAPLPNFLVPNQGVAYTIFKGGKIVGIATKNGIQKGKKKGKKKRQDVKVWTKWNSPFNIIVTRFLK